MEMMTVAPAPAAVPTEPASARSPAEDATPGVQPFEQALKQELAKPDTGAAEAAKPEEAPAEAAKTATAPHDKLPVLTPEWAALLESAGLGEETESIADAGAAEDSGLEGEAPLETFTGSDAPGVPHPLLATPVPVRAPDTGLASEKRIAMSETRLRGEAHATRAADEADAQALGAQSDAPAADALLAAIATERATSTEAPKLPSSALEGLASTAYAPRWSTSAPGAADAAAVQAPATARIDTAFGESGWGDAFKQKVVWLVDRQQQTAELHVNPPHLGPVEVTLNLAEDGTHIAFSSPHAAVREAIEASLADLKTALGDKGLSLGQATVGADSQAAREQLQGQARTGSSMMRGAAADLPVDMPLPQRALQRGLVDIFA